MTARIGRLRKVGILTVVLVACAIGAATFTFAGLHESPGGDGETAYLGVQIREETELSEGGARVTRVVEDSPAAEAGLEDGDVVVRFDGHTVRGPLALTERIHELEPGDRVRVVVMRDGRERTLDVELGSRPGRSKMLESLGIGELDRLDLHLEGLENLGEALELHLDELDLDDLGEKIRVQLSDLDLEGLEDLDLDLEGLEGLGDGIREKIVRIHKCEGDDCESYTWHGSNRPLLGVHLTGTTPELREHFGGDEDAGVLVSKIVPDTPAEENGIRVGDMIVAMDGETIESAGDIRDALRDKYGETVAIEIIRDGSLMEIDVFFPEKD